MSAPSKGKPSPYSARYGLLRLRDAAKTSRFWAAVLALPLTILTLPAMLSGLLAPAILLKAGVTRSNLFVASLLFLCAVSVAAVLVFAWSWIAAGRVPEVRDRRRRRFFFLLVCAGNLSLCYFGGLLLDKSLWLSLLFFAGAAALARGLAATAAGAR